MHRKYDKSELEAIVKNSLSISDVCRAYGVVPRGGNYRTIKGKLIEFEINTEHFTGAAWNQGAKFVEFGKKLPLSEILIQNSTYSNTNCLKGRLIKEGIKQHRCERCKLDSWLGELIPIELNHINGDNRDHRINNLEILCPNCHAKTNNYRGKNKNGPVVER